MYWKRSLPPTLVLVAITTSFGCGQAERKLAHEMKVFALAYHQMTTGEGKISVDDGGVGKIEWNSRPGPSKLEEMAASESGFPELAKRIREGTFVVVWRGRLRATAEENNGFFLGHEAGVEKNGGWVLRADGWPERLTAQEFNDLKPLPTK